MLAGRYELIELLGRGGFGEVWRAHDTVLGRDVAVKTVTLEAEDAALRQRFEREARALARLDDPHVVAVYDTGADDGTGYVVMQLLSGPSLAALLAEQGALPLDRALDYVRQAAQGLSAAHHAGIVHRDISPSNLMLDTGGVLKLVDFGVARLDGAPSVTATGTVFATAGYVSPEQAAGRPADARSDLYSLGCVLYALLAGEPPFTAEHPLGPVRPDIDALLADLLAKNPRDRPASADEVVRHLGADTTAQTVALTRPRRRRPTLLLAGAALVLLVVGVVLATTLGSGGSTTTPPPTTSSPPPTTTAPATTTTPTTTAAPPPTVVETPQTAIAAVRRAIAATQSNGALDPSAADDLNHQLDDIEQSLTHPNPQDATHKVADLIHHLGDLEHGGQLSTAGAAEINASLERLAALLPAAPAPPGPGNGKKKGDGND